jgi:hypothetical protein
MVSLAAAAPMDPAQVRGALEASRAGTDVRDEAPADAEADAKEAQVGMDPIAPPNIAPMFDLYFTKLEGGAAAPALECVVIDPPGVLMPGVRPTTIGSFRGVAKGRTREGALLSRRISQSVRGVFEVGPMTDGGWALQWRAVDPPATPVMLIPRVSRVEWWALPIDESSKAWKDTMSSKLAEEFPIAVRLEVWTDDGKHQSWMFETEMQVISTPGPEPVVPTGDQPADGADGEQDGGPDGARDEEDQE